MSTPKLPRDSFQLQERDLGLLRALLECRIMTAAHAAVLHFDGRAEAAKKRLQKLKSVGLLTERRRQVNEPAVLFLSRAGLVLLADRGVTNGYPALSMASLEKRSQVSDLTIRHELAIMDVKTAFHHALRGHAVFSIAEFGTWPRLYQFEAVTQVGIQTVVRPDGFIRIHEKEPDGGLSEHAFFLEVDRSTETVDTLVSRAYAYLDFYKSGGFAERNGAPAAAFREYPFRVLMVFKTAERRNNIAERLLSGVPPILTQVCLTTFEEATDDPLGAIWIRPVDYRDVVGGTAHESKAERFGYKRQTARDSHVEATIQKQRVLVEN
jgi:hypothetical protein